MSDIQSIKKLFSITNLFYLGAVAAVIVTMIAMGLVYSDSLNKNTQASLILSDAEGIYSVIDSQNQEIEKLSKNYFGNLPTNMSSILSSEFKRNDFTRYLDNLESQYKANGVFTINSLNYATQLESQNYIDATINLNTSKTNLISFLKLVERSGFSQEEPPYLLEVQNINFSVPSNPEDENTEEDNFSFSDILNPSIADNLVYTVSLQLRVYRFQSNLNQ